MSVVKEILEKELISIDIELSRNCELHKDSLNEMGHLAVDSLDEHFKNYDITVKSDEIKFIRKEDKGSWNGDFRITRSYDHHTEEYKFPHLSYGSYSTVDESILKSVVCMGILAKHFLDKTEELDKLISLMNYFDELKKRDLRPLQIRKQEIERELQDIKMKEYSNKLDEAFKKGFIEFEENRKLSYGNGRRDYVTSKRFEWEMNPSGKTYNMYYFIENNKWDGSRYVKIGEPIRYNIGKKVKEDFIKCFIRSKQK